MTKITASLLSSALLARVAALGVLVLGTAAMAASPPIALVLDRFLVHEDEARGETRLEPALEARPGSTFLERLTAQNETDEELRDVVVVIPVADGTSYLSGSASVPVIDDAEVQPQFSYDGGLTYGSEPLTREIVRIENGEEVREIVVVPPAEYTNVLWRLPTLPASDSVVVSFRSVLE